MMQKIVAAPPLQVFRVRVPRANMRDAEACETMLAALGTLTQDRRKRAQDGALALEIVSLGGETSFLIRGYGALLAQARAQLAAAYPQAQIEALDERRDWVGCLGKRAHTGAGVIRQTRPMYLPLLTHRTRNDHASGRAFESAADPMIPLVQALEGAHASDICAVQFAIQPLGAGWAGHFRDAARTLALRERADASAAAHSPLGAVNPFLALALLLGLSGAGFVWAAARFGIAGAPMLVGWGFIALALLLLPFGFRSMSRNDPELILRKCARPILAVRARIYIGTDSGAEALAERFARVNGALLGYGLPGGNSLTVTPLKKADPGAIALVTETGPVIIPALAHRANPRGAYSILSADELAALWHLPHGEAALQSVAYTSSRRLLPLPEDVASGLHIGVSQDASRSIDVKLSREALRGNIGLIAKTQSGKSNLMALLTHDVIANEPNAVVIVIDPHRTLVDQVARMTPPERADKTIYWSLADRERPFGFNVIERGRALDETFVDKLIHDLIRAMELIWPKSWGDRMESYLQGPLITLARANQVMIRQRDWVKWLELVRLPLDASAAAIARGRLDADARAMIGKAVGGFTLLSYPEKADDARHYADIQVCVKRWHAAFGALGVGAPAGHAQLAHAARLLHAAVKAQPTLPRAGARHPAATLESRFIDRTSIDRGATWPLQYTLLDVSAMLINPAMRAVALSGLASAEHAHVLSWWMQHVEQVQADNRRLYTEMIGPVNRKINEFAMSDVARRIFGQPESTLDLGALLSDGGTLLVDLAAGEIGRDVSALIGSMLLNLIAYQIYSQKSHRPRKVFLVVDEFQSIPGANYALMLSELAKYGVQLVLGTQSLGVLEEASRETRLSWMANVSTLFVFRSGSDDAEVLASELSIGARDGRTVEPGDINGLADHACFVRTRGANGAPIVFRVETRKADAGNVMMHTEIVTRSRAKYGVDAKIVDRWLEAAFQFQNASTGNAAESRVRTRAFARSKSVPKEAAPAQDTVEQPSDPATSDPAPDAEYLTHASRVERQDDYEPF